MKKKIPRLKTDREAEPFLGQDLSSLDFPQVKPVRFEFEKKDEQINMRVPKPLLAAVKAQAKARGIPYTRFIRETLEMAVTSRQRWCRIGPREGSCRPEWPGSAGAALRESTRVVSAS